MDKNIKTVSLKKDNSRTIIIVLSVVIVILMAAIIVLASKKSPAATVNTNETHSQLNAETNNNTESSSGENANTQNLVNTADQTKANDDRQALRHKVTVEPNKPESNGVVKDEVKTVYLTFDDGPSPYTPEILKILDKYNVKATFFVINGNYNKYMKDIVEHGHAIALHTYTHDYKKIYSSEEAYYNDLQAISDVVYNETGVKTKIIRFPGGGSNTTSRKYCSGIMSKLTTGVQEKGYYYFDWNVTSGDADGNNIPTDKLISQCKQLPSYTNTAIVLMHDTQAKRTTVEALPTIIENYIAMGCKFDLITSTTEPIHHKVNN